MTIREV